MHIYEMIGNTWSIEKLYTNTHSHGGKWLYVKDLDLLLYRYQKIIQLHDFNREDKITLKIYDHILLKIWESYFRLTNDLQIKVVAIFLENILKCGIYLNKINIKVSY